MQLRSKRNNNETLILADAQQLPIQQLQQPLKIKRRKELGFVVYDVSPDGSDVSDDASERTVATKRRKKRALETTPRNARSLETTPRNARSPETSARKEYNARSPEISARKEYNARSSETTARKEYNARSPERSSRRIYKKRVVKSECEEDDKKTYVKVTRTTCLNCHSLNWHIFVFYNRLMNVLIILYVFY
jgi:hypothetical protein